MNTLILAVALAALMPIVFAGLAKRQGGYDNRAPRAWLAQLEGAQARAQAAQENSLEAFPPFAAAVIFAVVLWNDFLGVLLGESVRCGPASPQPSRLELPEASNAARSPGLFSRR